MVRNLARALALFGLLGLCAGCTDEEQAASSAATPAPRYAHGQMSADDLAHLDLPIFPTIRDVSVIRKMDGPGYAMTVMLTTFEKFQDVDEWYSDRIDDDFIATVDGTPATGLRTVHLDVNGNPPVFERSVTIEDAKDSRGGDIVVITLQTMSTSKYVPRKDWHS